MTEIVCLTAGHPLWEKVAEFAESCSWRAGVTLASFMRSGRFSEHERVFAAFIDGTPAGFCTLTDKDALDDKYGISPFIGFVFVEEQYRGRRLSEGLIKAALSYAGSNGTEKVYLTSEEQGLYEKYGFTKLGDGCDTIYGTKEQLFVITT